MMTASDATINLLSQKLEKLPLNEVDYFMTSSVAEKISTLFCFQKKKTNSKYQQQQDSDDVLFLHDPFQNWNITPKNSYYKNNIYDFLPRVTRQSDDVDLSSKSSSGIRKYETQVEAETNISNNKVQNTDVISKQDASDVGHKNNKSFSKSISPVFSEALPLRSKASPNKRKRSSDSFSSDLKINSSCDMEDLEICNIYRPICRNIHRTLSLDDELLQINNEKLIYPTYRSSKRLRNRPSVTLERMTCKSQPSRWEEQTVPRGRKVKVIQIKPLKEQKNDLKRNGKPSHCPLSNHTIPFTETNNSEHIFRPILFAADVKL